jgi:hypothetical protein
MESILKEKQVAAPGALFLDQLFERYEIVCPEKRSRVRQGLGVGLVCTVIVLNTVLSFV